MFKNEQFANLETQLCIKSVHACTILYQLDIFDMSDCSENITKGEGFQFLLAKSKLIVTICQNLGAPA